MQTGKSAGSALLQTQQVTGFISRLYQATEPRLLSARLQLSQIRYFTPRQLSCQKNESPQQTGSSPVRLPLHSLCYYFRLLHPNYSWTFRCWTRTGDL